MHISNLNNAADLASALALGSAAADAPLRQSLPALTDAAISGGAKAADHVCLSDECREHSAKLAAQAKQAAADKLELAVKHEHAEKYAANATSRSGATPAHTAQDTLPAGASLAPTEQDVANAPAASTSPDRSVSQDDLNGLLAAYGAATGDPRFDSRFDYNSDGRIDFDDLNTALSSFNASQTPPVPTTFTLNDVASIVTSYGRRTGEQGFDARFDTNSDGIIDFNDLNHVLSNLSSPITQNQQQQLQGVIEGYGAGVGDPQYNAAYDVDNDGRISFADLNAVLSSFTAPQQPEPSTATPPTPQTFSLNDVTSLLSSYGRSTGEQGFDARFDTNNDGRVDFSDLNHVLSNLSSPITSNHQQQLEGLIQGYGAGVGDPLFNSAFDFDNDGRISFADLNELLSRIGGQSQ